MRLLHNLITTIVLICSLSGLFAVTGQAKPRKGLTGTSRQLVKFDSSDDITLTPDNRSKYTVSFGKNGRVAVRLDCNRGSGTYKSTPSGRLQLGPLALTRAMCPDMKLHDRVAKDWTAVRSYIIKDQHLFLSLMADGGIYYLNQCQLNQKSQER